MEDFSKEPTDETTASLIRHSDVKSSPQESVKTIDRASRLKMNPDNYKSMESTLGPESEIQERVPAQVSPAITTHMGKSAEHANAIKDDIGFFEKAAKQVKYINYNLTEKFKLEEEIFELENKNRLSAIKDHELEYLDSLYDEQQQEQTSFGLEGDELLLGQAAGLATDMVRTIGNNWSSRSSSSFRGSWYCSNSSSS